MQNVGIPLARSGTEAEFLVCANLEPREFGHPSDSLRTRIGENVLLSAPSADDLALSAAGTSTLALKTYRWFHSAALSAAAGAGVYTRKIVLPITVACDAPNAGTSIVPLTGSLVLVQLDFVATANPTVAFYNATDAGTLLINIPNADALARVHMCLFRFNGVAWKLVAGLPTTLD